MSSMSSSARKLVIALPIDTSAPTYRKIAMAPNMPQRDLTAVMTEGRWPSSTGFATSSNRRKTKMKTASNTMAPAMIRNAMSMLRSDSARCSGVTASPLCAAKMPPASSSPDTRIGASQVPNELNACENVRRKCERSGGPSAAASGLATTCRIVMPLAITNSPTSTSANVSKNVAVGITRHPSTITPSANRIDLLLPRRAMSAAAGSDTTKYAMKNANCVSIASA
jgi:hypothetical protein